MHLQWENWVRMLLHLELLAFASVIDGVADGLMLEVIFCLMDHPDVLLVAMMDGFFFGTMNMGMDVSVEHVSVVRLQHHGSHKG